MCSQAWTCWLPESAIRRTKTFSILASNPIPRGEKLVCTGKSIHGHSFFSQYSASIPSRWALHGAFGSGITTMPHGNYKAIWAASSMEATPPMSLFSTYLWYVVFHVFCCFDGQLHRSPAANDFLLLQKSMVLTPLHEHEICTVSS